MHGITNEFLADKPKFIDIAEEFMRFVDGAELIIHNAPFDIGFLDHELGKLATETRTMGSACTVLDTLKLARDKHPGQKNSLDALCRRYDVDNTNRTLHGALLDAEILADVYLAMTGGQVSLSLADEPTKQGQSAQQTTNNKTTKKRKRLKVIKASRAELAAHKRRLEQLDEASDGNCVWLKSEAK